MATTPGDTGWANQGAALNLKLAIHNSRRVVRKTRYVSTGNLNAIAFTYLFKKCLRMRILKPIYS